MKISRKSYNSRQLFFKKQNTSDMSLCPPGGGQLQREHLPAEYNEVSVYGIRVQVSVVLDWNAYGHVVAHVLCGNILLQRGTQPTCADVPGTSFHGGTVQFSGSIQHSMWEHSVNIPVSVFSRDVAKHGTVLYALVLDSIVEDIMA